MLGKNESPILNRREKDCPDVIVDETVVKVPRKYREDIKALQEEYDLYPGLIIDISLQELSRLCEREYIKTEAYRGLKKFLLQNFGVILNIYSQKQKKQSDK